MLLTYTDVSSFVQCKPFHILLTATVAYKKDVDSEVKKETSGDYKDILLQILEGKKDKGAKLDQAKAEADAKALHDVTYLLFLA